MQGRSGHIAGGKDTEEVAEEGHGGGMGEAHLVLRHAVDERVARLGVCDEEGAHARREGAEEVGGQQHGGGECGEQAPRTEHLPR